MTSGSNALPLNARHEFWALCVSLNTIARHATREPDPLVLPVLRRTPANVLSIGLVTIVNRDQIKKVADEHKMALTGLVDSASAAQLGKFLSANYVIVGRASKIGQTYYVVVKIIDVGTTVQTTVSAKSPAEAGLDALLDRLKAELAPKVRELQKPVATE